MKTFIRIFFAAILLIFSVKVYASEEQNVILISIDTLRADHLGCYGYSRDTSPTIDKLAQEGVLFLNAFSHSPKTTQSHMSMMTSLHHEVHKVCIWEGDNPIRRLDDAIPTLAEILRANGYATAAFTGGSNVDGSLGFDRGFDIYSNNGTIGDVLSWLDKNRDKKFFVFFHTYALHDPYLPPIPYNRMYYPEYKGKVLDSEEKICAAAGIECKEANIDKHEIYWEGVNKDNSDDIKFLVAQYDAAMHFVDNEMILPLLNKLKGLSVYKNTLIIFTADHGEAFKEHNNFQHNDLYVETLRVPLIMVSAKVLPRNKEINQLVRLTDIMPTIFDILNIKSGFLMQGKSLLTAIKGKNLNLSCYSKFQDQGALRTNHYSYITKKLPIDKRGLYDRQKDAKETCNLLTNNTKLAQRLDKDMFKEDRECERIGKRFSSLNTVSPDVETLQKIKSLGYLQ
jgi:arylsulfatase A-like enzyme